MSSFMNNPTTTKVYRNVITKFLKWGGFLPASKEDFERYMEYCKTEYSPGTILVHLTALSDWHARQGFPNPVQGFDRSPLNASKKGTGSVTRPVFIREFRLIVEVARSANGLAAVRDLALLTILYFGGLQIEQVAGLTVEQIAWFEEGVKIAVHAKPQSQRVYNRTVAIAFSSDELCCPCRALRAWLELTRIRTGAVFRPVDRWGMVGSRALAAPSLSAIVKRYAYAANVPFAERLSSRSLRYGMLSSAVAAGWSTERLQKAGGWKRRDHAKSFIRAYKAKKRAA